jgi:hypothetical protein
LEIELEILQANEEEPNLSIRRLALRVGVSAFFVYCTLYLYHVQRVEALQHGDLFRRIAFCKWRGRKIDEVPNFLSRLLTTDEIETV